MVLIEAPLSALVVPQVQVRFDRVVERWDLPESDRSALLTWGLPVGPALRPAPQPGALPTLRPTVAGERERQLVSGDEQLYLLGIDGTDTDPELMVQVGAIAGTGRVMGISARPMTADDLAPGLRPFKPDLYYPAVSHYNGSVSAFVEVAWRWYAADRLIGDHPGPDDSAPLEAHHWYYAELKLSCATFLARMALLDPTLGDNGLDSAWAEEIYEILHWF
ncbi:SUKH-4 family immunity protein [Cryptosporangium minutisporangium]|uniref:Uncharacterized protein n=1 Tax=Cryptosporangium minutisporangium TaxID=113569 RepID=A0ABP6SZK0_9ACTN